MMRRVFAAWLALVAAFLAGACGESTPFEEEPFVAAIRLSSSDCSGLLVGEKCTLVANAFDAAGDPFPDPRLFWRSANIVFATVSGTGVVTGVLPGTALIIVETTNRSVADTASVRVLDRPPPPPPPAN